VPFGLAGGLLFLRLRRCPAAVRAPLRVLLAGYVAYLAASLVWYVGTVRFGLQLPFPSAVDALFFLSYAVFAAFLVMLLRRRARGDAVESRVALIDCLILTVSLCAVLWVAVVEPASPAARPL
jgi:hypothetical protein